MKRKSINRMRLLGAIACFAASTLSATTYYVNPFIGNDTYNGTSITASGGSVGPWKTITHAAAATLSPGDVVYVRSGKYTGENIVVASSGTSGNPISFLGYYDTIVSIPTIKFPAVLAPTATVTTIFSTATMPTISGTNRNTGMGIDIRNKKYVTFKNFQIENYEYGVLTGGSAASASGNIVLENINLRSIGDPTSGYDGFAFSIGILGSTVSNNNTFTNCLVINSGAEGLGICGDYNTLTGCKVLSNETGNAGTNFFINVCGANNTVTNCYVERATGITGATYGIGARTNARQVDANPSTPLINSQNNTFTDCIAKNIASSFYVHFRTAQNNTFTRCKAIGTYVGNASGAPMGEGGGIEIRDGANTNTFNAFTALNCAYGITFEDTTEDGDTGSPAPGHPSNYNKIINSIFNNCYYGVTYKGNSAFTTNDAGDNTIGNSTFYKIFFNYNAASSHCTKMKYIGNIYYGCLPNTFGGAFKTGTYSSDLQVNGTTTYFKYCDFYQIEGGAPAGYVGTNNNIGTDPQFVDAPNKNLHLKSTSPCVNTGSGYTLVNNPTDFDGLARFNGSDAERGAFEYYQPQIYYVDKAGNNSNTGLSQTVGGSGGPWATLTYAATYTNLKPGDIVYVKAGDYGNENVVFTKSGTEGNPISFIGYVTTPGDITTPLVTTATATTTFNTASMPTYTGTSRNVNTGFNAANQKYLIIKNFQITKYDTGIKLGGASPTAGNNIIENINVKTLGDPSSYGGRGILLGSMGTDFSDYNTVKSCLALDAAAEGISIAGNYNTISDCKVFSQETAPASTDYYLMICGSYNTINNCYVNRKTRSGLEGAHGMGVKTNAEQIVDAKNNFPPIPAQYNTFTNCGADGVGEGFYVRHRTAQYNLFSHCTANGYHDVTDANGGTPNGAEGNGIEIRDGASDNTFDGIVANYCSLGISIDETVEDGDTGLTPPGHPGNNNKIVNSIFNRCYIGVFYGGDPSFAINDAGDNTIAHNTFYRTRYMHIAESHCTKMKYVGNIYYGAVSPSYGGDFIRGTYVSDFQPNGTTTYFKQNDMNNIEGTTIPSSYFLTGAGNPNNISSAPGFVSSTDWHLASTSACIDKVSGVITCDFDKIDFDGLKRCYPTISDMGAYEYNSIPPPPFATNIEAIDEKEIVIYPNPSNGSLLISSSLDASYTISVYSMTGQSVYNASYTPNLNLTNLNTGIYFVQIISAEGKSVFNKKIMIE